MKAQELSGYRTRNADMTRRIEVKAKTASVEQLKGLCDESKQRMMAALAEYEQEVKFRPSYAPAPTRTEQVKLSAFWDAREFFRYVATLYRAAEKAQQ